MTTLTNEILVQAPMEKVWNALANIEELAKYDPTVKEVKALSSVVTGLEAKRKVNMLDGKNWFEEKCSRWEPNQKLSYTLTACSFPIQGLQHTYTFEKQGDNIKVTQVMTYQMKYGWLGKMMDRLMVKKQTTRGIHKFFAGLKAYLEAA